MRKNILRGSEREFMCLSVLGSKSKKKYEEEDFLGYELWVMFSDLVWLNKRFFDRSLVCFLRIFILLPLQKGLLSLDVFNAAGLATAGHIASFVGQVLPFFILEIAKTFRERLSQFPHFLRKV